MEEKYHQISKEKLQFARPADLSHDKKLESKSVGYFRDAFRRFCKNKASVAAAIIIFFLVLFAIFSPILSQYKLTDRDDYYTNKVPYNKHFAKLGFWDGTETRICSEADYNYLRAIGEETGYNPIVKIVKEFDEMDGKIAKHYYKLKVNVYYEVGVLSTITVTEKMYNDIIAYQDEHDVQIIYPYVEKKSIGDGNFNKDVYYGNYWYQVKNNGAAILDADGNFQPVYAMQDGLNANLYPEYNSKRTASDPYDPENGNVGYAYAKSNTSGYEVRICYYEYYKYLHGFEPNYLLGTNTYGEDMFCAIGKGARFSLLLALCVSAVNIFLGALYGAIEGYYGGAADMIMERISDILSGIPLMIVVTLFNLHLASKCGVVPAFILAFVATGWIGMASLTRKQFYRFKNQEYVLAARTLGAKDRRVMFKHILPNSLGTIITSCVLVIPGVIASEAMLTYLGIVNLGGSGQTSLGILMQLGNACVTSTPHVLLYPALFLALLEISFNLFGNGLRDAFNPSLRGVEE